MKPPLSGRPNTESDDDRPWEQPGAVRRDVEPHRGLLLSWLSTIGLALSIFGCCFPFPGLLVNGVVFVAARRDLAAMAAGRVDPDGRRYVANAKTVAAIGLVLNAVSALAIFLGFLVDAR